MQLLRHFLILVDPGASLEEEALVVKDKQPRGPRVYCSLKEPILHLSPVHTYTHPPIHHPSFQSIYPPICPSIHLSSVFPISHSFTPPLTSLPSFHSSIQPPVLHPFIHLSIHSTQTYTEHEQRHKVYTVRKPEFRRQRYNQSLWL